jgi:hypothetical protein
VKKESAKTFGFVIVKLVCTSSMSINGIFNIQDIDEKVTVGNGEKW